LRWSGNNIIFINPTNGNNSNGTVEFGGNTNRFVKMWGNNLNLGGTCSFAGSYGITATIGTGVGLKFLNSGVIYESNTYATSVKGKLIDDSGIVSTAKVDPNCILQLNSTERAFKMPRMTESQKNAIVSPTEGMLVYDTTNSEMYLYDGTGWKRVHS